MSIHQITHIRKPDRYSNHEHITHVGNLSEGWIITREDAISRINSGTNNFFVMTGQHRSEVGIVKPNNGMKPYLRTHADGYWNDNLLSLPQC
ncbi:MAG: DUF3892 domain-containing protein [bacterium]